VDPVLEVGVDHLNDLDSVAAVALGSKSRKHKIPPISRMCYRNRRQGIGVA
jgi:hypothetical protein